MSNPKRWYFFISAAVCAVVCFALLSNSMTVGAQSLHFKTSKEGGAAPAITATLTDSFPDPDGDGKAQPGTEITYTATIINNGTTDAVNVTYTNTVDSNSTVVANSVIAQPDFSQYVVRCTFNTANGGSGSCAMPSSAYGSTDLTNNYTIIGGQGSNVNVSAINVNYNSANGVFSFDSSVQNLLAQSLGTIDGTNLDAAGVRLFLNRAAVTSGSGSVSVVNADGTQTFTAPNQPYFQYDQILAQNDGSIIKNIQLNVPNTVANFNLDFLISTKVAVKLVINEVLVNPGGTITDASGEWFEVYNNGLFPVNMQNFKVGDSSAAGDRPLHTIASSLTIQPGAYLVFGNTTNTTNNGGVPVDYAYGSALALANSLDAVRLISPVNDFQIDRATYNSPAVSAQNGISRELKNPAFDNSNMDGSNWADASVTAVYGPGGRGTPKAQNSTFTPFAESHESVNFPTVAFSGETVTANLGTITPGGAATVTYRVTVSDPVPPGVTQISSQGTVTGGNFAAVATDDTGVGGANDATVTELLVPSAANVFVSGRVVNAEGLGVSKAQVLLVNSSGNAQIARTNPFGYFRFQEVAAGETYIISVSSKRYVFPPQAVFVSEDLSDLILMAVP